MYQARIDGKKVTVDQAAKDVGFKSAAAIRKRRERDPEFAREELAVRGDEAGVRVADEVKILPLEERPWPANLTNKELQDKAQDAADKLKQLGNGPWRGTVNNDAFNRAAHGGWRETLQRLNSELGRRNLPTHSVPPPANERPKPRRKGPWTRRWGYEPYRPYGR
jgi:hypothetical protein